MVALNADARFVSHVTLTYRARTESWEDDAKRNGRVVERSKSDLHRFLRCLRREGGDYLWVQEFQERGVIHYHVLFIRAVSQERAALVWARASEQLHDGDVLRHGVKVDAVRSERGARSYLGKYIGKGRQKVLPEGVGSAGRWWGRSRSLRLMALDEVVSYDPEEAIRRPAELRIMRAVRRYLSKVFSAGRAVRRKFRGGAFPDYGGELSKKLHAMVVRLREHFGVTASLGEMLAGFGWGSVEVETREGEGNGDVGDHPADGDASRVVENKGRSGGVVQGAFDFEGRRLADVEAGGSDGGREAPQDGGEAGAQGETALCARGTDR